MKRLFFIMLFSCTISFSFSQTRVFADGRIYGLVAGKSNLVYQGFRLHISSSRDQAAIQSHRRTFISEFPGIDTYVDFSLPNYFFSAGNFRTRAEAEAVLEKLSSRFPAAKIKSETIELPRID